MASKTYPRSRLNRSLTVLSDMVSHILPTPRSRRYIPDPLAFFGALVGAPILVAICGAPLFLIPVFAVIFGGIPYLLMGTPILLWALPRWGRAAA